MSTLFKQYIQTRKDELPANAAKMVRQSKWHFYCICDCEGSPIMNGYNPSNTTVATAKCGNEC